MSYTKQTLFTAGSQGYHTYRIPTLITLRSGRVLAFCEGRRDSAGDSGSIDILLRASDDGAAFGDLRVVVPGREDTVNNPSPVQDPSTGRVFLLYNTNKATEPESLILQGKGARGVMCVWSDDEGVNWSGPADLSAAIKRADWTWYAIGPCHGAVTPAGRLIFGCNHAVLDPDAGASGPYISHIIYSDDHGATWKLGADIAPGTNECSIAAFEDGGLLINTRYMEYRPGVEQPLCRTQAWSCDGGVTFHDWGLCEQLLDPACQGSVLAVHTDAGEEVLLTNAASARREALTLKRSTDRGISWRTERVLEPGPSAYSDITQLADGRIAVLCEAGEHSPYERIDLHVFELG